MLFRKAILIIHGFAGGTYDEEELANYLELNKHYDVFQYTLPGHEKNLSKVKYQEWINASEKKVEWLIKNGYNSIYLIGHSMGGVIATYLATKYNKIKKLVLAAPAFQYLDVIDDSLNISNSIKMTPKVIKTYGGDEIFARLLKLNPSSIREFMFLVKKYYNYPKLIKCPILLLQGNNDNLVPLTSVKYVYDSVLSKIKKIIYINGATHDIFRSVNNEKIFTLVEEFFKNPTSGIYTI